MSNNATKREEKPRWLDDMRNVNRIVYGLVAVCALLLLADLLYEKHGHYAFESWFGFFGLYGFAVCVGLVLTAKALRKVLRRDEDYYDR